MMYTANTNSAGCQTYRSKPYRLATQAQGDGHEPGADHHERDRRNVYAEQVDLREAHAVAPASK